MSKFCAQAPLTKILDPALFWGNLLGQLHARKNKLDLTILYTLQVLARLLYNASEYVDPDMVEEVLGVPESEAGPRDMQAAAPASAPAPGAPGLAGAVGAAINAPRQPRSPGQVNTVLE